LLITSNSHVVIEGALGGLYPPALKGIQGL